jgi:LDH2 family malate/lactate/ureidoglycolate dehydrogenase
MTDDLIEHEADFLEHLYRKIWLSYGADPEHADAVARAVSFGDRMGKVNQGLGVFEVIDLTFKTGTIDIKSRPELVQEGPTFAVYEGHRTTGHWMLTIATQHAIEIARKMGVGMVMSRNHNDAGCFSAYTAMAVEEDMFCLATNNSIRLVAPYGAMENRCSGAPFSAASPGGEETPIFMDMAAIEAYDADVSEAYFSGEKMKAGKVLADPETGELTDDPAPYIQVLDDYARIADSKAATVFKDPRIYAINCLTEALSTFMVPGATISPELPYPIRTWFEPQEVGSVGGSFVLVINPAVFGQTEEYKAKSDRFVRACKSAKPLPGVEGVRMPGEKGWARVKSGNPSVQVPAYHWKAFKGIAEEAGLDIAAERERFRHNDKG